MTKNILQFILNISLIFLFPIYSLSQNPDNIEISKNKVSIDGKQYYIHLVKEGQTLFSIIKAYNANEKEIISLNPGVQYGLHINQAIKIPVSSNNINVKSQCVNNTKSDSIFIKHITEPKETISSIANFYNVSTDTILALNPKIQKGLKSGMVLRIPRINPQTGIDVKTVEKLITHYVQKKETIFSISKKYNVSISSIIRENKELLWGGLREGQIIDIPIIDTIVISPEIVYVDTIDTLVHKDYYFNLLTGMNNYNLNNIPAFPESMLSNPINLTLLLPFNYNQIIEQNTCIDTCKQKDRVKQAKKKRRELKLKTDLYTDFYLGTLLALDSIKKCGISVNLSIYDTQGDSNIVRYLINKYDLINSHVIIGPMEKGCINTLLDYLGNTDVRIILPRSYANYINKYKNVFQVIPSEEVLKEHYAHYIALHYDKNIVLVCNNDSLSKIELLDIKNHILRFMDYYGTIDSAVIKEIYYNDTLALSLNHALTLYKDNYIVIISKNDENEAFISNITRELYNIKGEYNISVVGNHGWINLLSYNNLNIEYLHTLNIIYFTPFYIDYSKENLKHFLQYYRDKFKNEPYQQSSGINPTLFGYDLCLFFLSSFSNMNQPEIVNNKYKSLLTDFEFIQKEANGGFENVSVTFISYENDYEVRSFKPYKLE